MNSRLALTASGFATISGFCEICVGSALAGKAHKSRHAWPRGHLAAEETQRPVRLRQAPVDLTAQSQASGGQRCRLVGEVTPETGQELPGASSCLRCGGHLRLR